MKERLGTGGFGNVIRWHNQVGALCGWEEPGAGGSGGVGAGEDRPSLSLLVSHEVQLDEWGSPLPWASWKRAGKGD